MADVTGDWIRKFEIIKRLIYFETVYIRTRRCLTVLDHMYDSYLNRISRMTIVWKRLCTVVKWTSCMVVYTVSYDRTHFLTIFYGRLYDYTRTGHHYRFLVLKTMHGFADTLEWPDCNSDKVTVGSLLHSDISNVKQIVRWSLKSSGI